MCLFSWLLCFCLCLPGVRSLFQRFDETKHDKCETLKLGPLWLKNMRICALTMIAKGQSQKMSTVLLKKVHLQSPLSKSLLTLLSWLHVRLARSFNIICFLRNAGLTASGLTSHSFLEQHLKVPLRMDHEQPCKPLLLNASFDQPTAHHAETL